MTRSVGRFEVLRPKAEFRGGEFNGQPARTKETV